MKVLVTGSTGFIGRHIVPLLLDRGFEVIATSRNENKAREFEWYSQVHYKSCDYGADNIDFYTLFEEPDIVVHLAWEGLPDYKNPIHVEKNLPENCTFLKNFLEGGIKKLVVTGTCYEYGMQCGCLSENSDTRPATQYGLGKDSLRRYLEFLIPQYGISFNWVRLFYMYGEGQNENSLIPQLQNAIMSGEKIFNMSGGEQLRDYLNVKDVADYICRITLQNDIYGIVNCCSGKPISVRSLVEKFVSDLNSDIKLNLGYYSYPDYEPFAFWGDSSRLKEIINNFSI